MKVHPEKTGALCANSHPGSYTGQDAYNDMLPVILNSSGGGARTPSRDRTGKEQEQGMETNGNSSSSASDRKYIVRRLTPLECCRLQGFPDWWENGANGSDSARYKMWGNGIALPCAADVLGRIAKEMEKQ